jgi:hypothetical protein
MNDSKKKKVRLSGKIAKFPGGTKAAEAINFLENVKISKNKIWYIMVEKQCSELQMIKYSTKKGVNLTEFFKSLKEHYMKVYEGTEFIGKINEIELVGDEDGNYSCLRNIPDVDLEGGKLLSKITEDLSKLLSGELDK